LYVYYTANALQKRSRAEGFSLQSCQQQFDIPPPIGQATVRECLERWACFEAVSNSRHRSGAPRGRSSIDYFLFADQIGIGAAVTHRPLPHRTDLLGAFVAGPDGLAHNEVKYVHQRLVFNGLFTLGKGSTY
jgi:hypothetical protein